jgi:hypothetical protein
VRPRTDGGEGRKEEGYMARYRVRQRMRPDLRTAEYVIEDTAEGNKVVDVFSLLKYGSRAKTCALRRRNLLNDEEVLQQFRVGAHSSAPEGGEEEEERMAEAGKWTFGGWIYK